MVARRRRPAARKDATERTGTKASKTAPEESPEYEEYIPNEENTQLVDLDPIDVVVLDSEEESSETDGISVQVADPAPDDSGYNADAEDANDNMNDAEDENDEDDYVEEKTDNDHASANDEGDNSETDEAFPAGQSEPENHETGVVEDTLGEQVSDGEDSRDATDDVEDVTESRNFDEARDRLSDGDASNDEIESGASPQDRTDIAQNEEASIDEGEESVRDVDGEQDITRVTEDPREEEDSSDEQEDGSENDDTVEVVSETVTSGRRYLEVYGTGVRVLDHGDPMSPGENDDVTDATEEGASEGEEGSGNEDVAQPIETIDDDSQSAGELGSEIIESEEQAGDEEPLAEADDNSDSGGRAGEQHSDREERLEYDDPQEIPAEKMEGEASDSEEEDDEQMEEEEDAAKEAGDPNIASSGGDGSDESAENGSVDQNGRRLNDTSDELENVEEQVVPCKSDDDDGIDDEKEDTEELSDAKAVTHSGDDIDERSVKHVIQAPESGSNSPDDAEKVEERVSTSDSDEDDLAEDEAGVKGETGNEKAATEDGDEDMSDYMEDSDDDDVNTREYKLVPPTVPATTIPDTSVAKEIEGASKRSNEAGSLNDSENGSNVRKRKVEPVETGIRPGDPKSGVIYLPRVPPGLDVTALRSLLSRITQPKRIWLRPETKEQRRRRQSLGGSRRKERFRDGWVELQTSKEARRVVGLLNGRPMTAGKRKGRWADDLWCLKYLKGFGWDDLTKEIFGGRERVLRVRESVMQGRRERAWIEGRGKGRGERVRRFRQKRALEDSDDIRAREAGERVDAEVQNGGGAPVDRELVGMLFKRRKT